ncbi:DUF3417 domain-containing protein, partial [Bacteroidales bacterium OttesenSCG-928-J19]|nr:DUF3417 domain-containing protein [Bacteroidales bacterium OttesenSCG-928-J19]
YREGAGWALTDKRTYDNQQYQDQLDAATIYSMLENEIVPLYYAKNSKGYSPEWIQYIKNSIAKIAPDYTMKRMFDDYINRFYNKLASRNKELVKNNYTGAKEIAAWKAEVASHWDEIELISVKYDDKVPHGIEIGDMVTSSLIIDKHNMKGDLGAELVRYSYDPVNKVDVVKVIPLNLDKKEGSKLYFSATSQSSEAGQFKLGIRVYPDNKDLPHRMDFAYVKWF